MKPLRLGLYVGQGDGADSIWMRREILSGPRAISLNFKPVAAV